MGIPPGSSYDPCGGAVPRALKRIEDICYGYMRRVADDTERTRILEIKHTCMNAVRFFVAIVPPGQHLDTVLEAEIQQCMLAGAAILAFEIPNT